MAVSTQPYKGARDFYPDDKRLQKYMFKTIRKVVEKYGYQEYDAPVLEPTELYTSKTSDEIVNEQTYTFDDRGGRSVTIRTEMTPTVSRMVAAKRQELAYPVRWYSIPNLWRYERPQRGRLREFWQPNVDIFGVEGIEADHEIIMVADAVLQGFKAQRDMYEIKLNSRRLMDTLFDEHLKLSKTQSETLARLIDRMHKMDYAEFVSKVEAIFRPSQRETGTPQLLAFLGAKSFDDIPNDLAQLDAAKQVRKLMQLLASSGVTNVVFDPTLMRGFDYYTDIVFEVFDTNPENNRSMFGGGRYDGLVTMFGVKPISAVGFAMGDVTLQNFLEAHGLMPRLRPETDLYVVMIGDVYEEAQGMLANLRYMGLKVAVDTTGRKADKQIKTAVKQGVRYALFIGEKELSTGRYMFKDLETGTEERHSAERVVSMIRDYRKRK